MRTKARKSDTSPALETKIANLGLEPEIKAHVVARILNYRRDKAHRLAQVHCLRKYEEKFHRKESEYTIEDCRAMLQDWFDRHKKGLIPPSIKICRQELRKLGIKIDTMRML